VRAFATARFPRSGLEESIGTLFDRAACRFPERVAVSAGAHGITYAALNITANGVAHALVDSSRPGPEPVALLLEPDERTISTVLGVLKAGKFYVPLDPSYPVERLSLMLTACDPGVLVTDRQHTALADALRRPPGCTIMDVDDLHRTTREDAPSVATPDSLAAVFYTSGSTGSSGGPKGVMQSHRAVLHRVMVDTNALHITPDDRLSLLTSPSYSVSLRHVFGALLNGAALCPFNVVIEGFGALPRWLESERITFYFSVPTVFRQFATVLTGGERFDSLRVLHVAGERVTAADFGVYKRYFAPSCLFVNSLASNETGIITMFIADRRTPLAEDIVPVGYPVEDKEVSVVDDAGEEVEAGCVGEIVVRSAFLAPGYWNRRDLTAAFEVDERDSRQRVYRTGDLGTRAADGCLTYRGRKDFRVKIRGIRVDPEEIELALQLHPDVEHAVVVMRDTANGGQRLFAFVVPQPGRAISSSDLRRFVAARLPRHMVPVAFVSMGALPITANGKVDRMALPDADSGRPSLDVRFTAPRTPLERTLVTICEATLGTTPIGVHDNLFDLGLDSLDLLRLVAQIEQESGRYLRPAALFGAPTVASLASMLSDAIRSGSRSSLVPIQTAGNKPPFFWIHGDASAVPLSRHMGRDQPFYALDHQGQDGRPAKYQDVRSIARYYLEEMRQVQPSGPYFIGGYSFGAVVALEIAQQLATDHQHTALLALLDPPSLVRGRRPGSQVALHRHDATWLGQRLEGIKRHLSRRPWSDALHSLAWSAWMWIASFVGLPRAADAWKRAVYRFCLVSGRPLPLFVRSRYALDLYARAKDVYVPQPYNGSVCLFKGKGRQYAADADWPALLTGDVEVHIVDADHSEIREPECVEVWAQQLEISLARCHDLPRKGRRGDTSDSGRGPLRSLDTAIDASS
jgi:amino acid adenylation domain-containing protein